MDNIKTCGQKLYLGIDPGANGAWAIIDAKSNFSSCGQHDSFFREPDINRVDYACIEKIQVWHSDSKGQIFRLQRLIEDFGKWQGILEALRINFKVIHPRTWRAHFGLSGKKNFWQGQAIEMARQLWPDAPLGRRKDDGVAVGLLLAELVRQKKALEILQWPGINTP